MRNPNLGYFKPVEFFDDTGVASEDGAFSIITRTLEPPKDQKEFSVRHRDWELSAAFRVCLHTAPAL